MRRNSQTFTPALAATRTVVGLAAAALIVILAARPGAPLEGLRPASAPTPAEGPAILTFHGDPARTGWTEDERVLTPAALRSGRLTRLWVSPVEGEIYAEPLVVPGLAMFGRVRTVVYTATNRDAVYALDAADGHPLWGPVSLGQPVPRSALSCGGIDPVGVTGTPVLDRGAGTLYVVGLTTPDGGRTKTYTIAALDVKSGAMRPGWPVQIEPPRSAGVRFEPAAQQQRGALLLSHGVVYVPFGGYRGGCGASHRWVVAVPTASPRAQEAFATPTHRMGGIWTAGGIAADSRGDLYVATGNSDSTAAVDVGDSVIRLRPFPALGFSGTPRDYFTPNNFVALNAAGEDLGSSVPLVLPDRPTGSTPRLLFIEGKQGVAYLLNRDNLGGVGAGNGVTGEGVFSRCVFGTCEGDAPQTFSAPAYWDGGSGGPLILVPGRGRQPAPCRGTGGVVALHLGPASDRGVPALQVAWCSRSMQDPGAPSTSGADPSGGVAWVVDTGPHAVLSAFDVRTGQELYRSTAADALGAAQRCVTPAVVGGRVYVGVHGGVVAYGLR